MDQRLGPLSGAALEPAQAGVARKPDKDADHGPQCGAVYAKNRARARQTPPFAGVSHRFMRQYADSAGVFKNGYIKF